MNFLYFMLLKIYKNDLLFTVKSFFTYFHSDLCKVFYLFSYWPLFFCFSPTFVATITKVARSKKLKKPNLAVSSFKKAKSSKMKKGQIKVKMFFKNLLKWPDSKLDFHKFIFDIASFVKISTKQALKYTIFFNIQEGQKMAKWTNHFISGKPYEKGQMATMTITILPP